MKLFKQSSQVCILAVALLLSAAQRGQAQEAIITGTVRAQGGGPLAGVSVAFNPGDVVALTDERGRYALAVPARQRGTVSFRRAGFLPANRPVQSARAAYQINAVLTPLFAIDALTVTAERERPMLETRSAVTGGSVERAELDALPTDARDPLALAFTIPGVSQATGFFGDAPPLTIHGGNSLYTQYFVDGLDNNEGFLGGPRVDFPLAAISRLSVLSGSYGAGMGRSASGIVDFETRAGRTKWDGEFFTYARPGIPVDASPKFAPAGTDPDGFRRLQVGGAAGGPLVRDRSFLFSAAEYSNEREDRIGSTARAQFIGTELREKWKLFGRVDHGWSPEQTTTLSFALSDGQRQGQGGGVVVPEADITTIRRGSITALTHRSLLGAGVASNLLSVQLGTFRWDFPPTESDLATPQVTIVSPDRTTIEAVVGSSNFVFDERETQLQIRDVLEIEIAARHRLRLGGDASNAWFRLRGSSTNPRGAYTVINDGNISASGRFLSIADIPPDVRVLRYSIDANPQQVDLTQTLLGLFIEDEWRATPVLAVNLGLRWDYDDITSRGESDPDLNNLQPRASFNWLASMNTVIRGGAGIYTGKFPYAIYSDAVQFGPDGNALVTFEGDAFPPPQFGAGPLARDMDALRDRFPPREVRRMFARGLEQPESYQFSLGGQWQLADNWNIAADGIWVETRHLPRSWDLNPLTRRPAADDTLHRTAEFGDPFREMTPVAGSFRRLTTTDTGGSGRYRALSVNLRRRVSKRVAGEATWVWARAQNDTEDINFNATHANDFDAEWADAVNDRRHHLTLRGFFNATRQLRLAAVADYQTGTPINRVAHFRDLDGSGDVFGNGFVGNHDRFFGVPRNAERLPNAFQLATSATIQLHLGDNTVDLRADVFNVLNAMIVTGFANGIPGGGPRTQTGRPGDPIVFTTAAPPRQLQFSATYVF